MKPPRSIPGHPGILSVAPPTFVTRTILPPPGILIMAYSYSAPVIVPPAEFSGLTAQITAPRPLPTPPDLTRVALVRKFEYWQAKTKRLYKEGDLDRLVQEMRRHGSRCYHGATGEDRRFAQWRLAFTEATRLMEQMGIA